MHPMHVRKSLQYWIPGASYDQMLHRVQDMQKFDEEIFLASIKQGKSQMHFQDEKLISETEKAFHFAFNPDKRVRSDYECMVVGEPMNIEPEPPQIQKCENPSCTGADIKWIECTSCGCWYHQSCAGIPQNKTNEEIDRMVWTCKQCKTNKLSRRR